MEGLKKFFRMPIGFYPIAIISYYDWSGSLSMMARTASQFLHEGSVDRYRGALAFDLLMLVVVFFRFALSLGLFFRNILVRNLFILLTGTLLIYNTWSIFFVGSHAFTFEKFEISKIIYRASIYVLFNILCLVYISLPSTKAFFSNESQ